MGIAHHQWGRPILQKLPFQLALNRKRERGGECVCVFTNTKQNPRSVISDQTQQRKQDGDSSVKPRVWQPACSSSVVSGPHNRDASFQPNAVQSLWSSFTVWSYRHAWTWPNLCWFGNETPRPWSGDGQLSKSAMGRHSRPAARTKCKQRNTEGVSQKFALAMSDCFSETKQSRCVYGNNASKHRGVFAFLHLCFGLVGFVWYFFFNLFWFWKREKRTKINETKKNEQENMIGKQLQKYS